MGLQEGMVFEQQSYRPSSTYDAITAEHRPIQYVTPWTCLGLRIGYRAMQIRNGCVHLCCNTLNGLWSSGPLQESCISCILGEQGMLSLEGSATGHSAANPAIENGGRPTGT